MLTFELKDLGNEMTPFHSTLPKNTCGSVHEHLLHLRISNAIRSLLKMDEKPGWILLHG